MAGGDSLNRTQKLKVSSNDDQPLDSMFQSAPSKSFLVSGSRAMLSFGAVDGVKRSGNPIFQSLDQEDEFLDEYFDRPEKKRRLSVDQIQFLEKSFEAENKLEPEKRIQLATELGLKPRQIAIWFQNRRARWKTRQLEINYETLHASYKSLKDDYDNLLRENEKLKSEVLCLKHNGLATDAETANLRAHDTIELSHTMPKEVDDDIISEVGEPKMLEVVFENDEQSSANCDLINMYSPRLTVNSSLLESGDSSRVLAPEQSDLSQNGEDNLNEELLQTDYIFASFQDHVFAFGSY